MRYFSNSETDLTGDPKSRAVDESAVRKMYEFAPYPGLGDDLKDMGLYLNPIRDELARRKAVRFLDVGCGTGHVLVGVAKSHPDWTCFGLDLSSASLKVAKELAELHGVQVKLDRGSYLDPLPYDSKFDVISAMGTIHHCADPVGALKNLAKYLKEDGFLLLHLYGIRCDQEKFDIKAALNILEPELTNYDRRFSYYSALMAHKRRRWLKRLALTTPMDVYAAVRNAWRNLQRRRHGTTWSPGFRERYDELNAQWIDHFCHPCERAYEVPEVKALIDASGFEVIKMLKQGRENMKLIPDEWRNRFAELDNWERWRLTELLSEGGGSFAMILRHRSV